MKESMQSIELKIALVLRLGVFLAGGCLLLSWIMTPYQAGNFLSSFAQYENHRLWDSLNMVWQEKKFDMIFAYIGLILLLILPVLRVFLTAILFLKQKEKILSLIASSVFLLLILSMALGLKAD